MCRRFNSAPRHHQFQNFQPFTRHRILGALRASVAPLVCLPSFSACALAVLEHLKCPAGRIVRREMRVVLLRGFDRGVSPWEARFRLKMLQSCKYPHRLNHTPFKRQGSEAFFLVLDRIKRRQRQLGLSVTSNFPLISDDDETPFPRREPA